MPGYYEEEQRAVKAEYKPEIKALKKDIYTIQESLRDNSKSSEWPALKERETQDRAQMKKLYSEWFSSDVQVLFDPSVHIYVYP